jgi:hypothetical protein
MSLDELNKNLDKLQTQYNQFILKFNAIVSNFIGVENCKYLNFFAVLGTQILHSSNINFTSLTIFLKNKNKLEKLTDLNINEALTLFFKDATDESSYFTINNNNEIASHNGDQKYLLYFKSLNAEANKFLLNNDNKCYVLRFINGAVIF